MEKPLIRVNPFSIIRRFIHLEASGGILLLVAAVFALIIDNTALHSYYDHFLHFRLVLHLGIFALKKTVLDWINEGLMTIFFLLVGLEIKREILQGELNSKTKALLPGIAAIGGMIFPALFYLIINYHDPITVHGWAIPTATDIAFALGVLTLLGSRVPMSLKIFLTAVAIFDDIGAVVIIALFYTAKISLPLLAFAMVCLLILTILNLKNIKRLWPYFIVGFILWLCVLQSGVHATLAGVALAAFIPLSVKEPAISPSRLLEERLHPWVAFIVLPLFGFANAGVSLQGISSMQFLNPLPFGIFAGLFLGKQIGILVSSWLAVKIGIAKLPDNLNWRFMYGCSLICGIGFTMSLFIAGLAFNQLGGEYVIMARLGILIGSLISGLAGYLFLRFAVVAE